MSTKDPIDQTPAPGRGKPVFARGKKAGLKSGAKDKAPGKPAGERDEVDLFIDEVTEELQKDRAYAAFRRYGPYAAAAIVLIVLAAAVNEYLGAAATESARKAGATFLELTETDKDPKEAAAALGRAAAEIDAPAAALLQLQEAARLQEAGDLEGARKVYQAVAAREDLSPLYRDLAVLRGAMAGFDLVEPKTLIQELSLLTSPGRPYRPLALELTGLAEFKEGRAEDARATLRRVVEADETPGYLRERAGHLLEAMGGTLPGTETTPPDDLASEASLPGEVPPGEAPSGEAPSGEAPSGEDPAPEAAGDPGAAGN